MFYNVQDVMEILGVGRSKAYEIIKKLNGELADQGYFTVGGKVSKKYFDQRFYGMEDHNA